jgi:hypothetical protein
MLRGGLFSRPVSCDVLNLEWSSAGRDREVATAICEALRRRGFRVVEESVFDHRLALLRHRPRLLYVADPTGARINLEAARYAEGIGVPTVSVDAEGNYREESVAQVLWGHVDDGRLRERIKLMWSRRARDLVLGAAPELSGRLQVTGAVGFDRYRLMRFADAGEWRRRYDFDHPQIVGYAGWAFHVAFGSGPATERWRSVFGDDGLARFRRDRDALRSLLAELIEANPETMFVIKDHPAAAGSPETETAGLERFANVLRIAEQESIGDCISVCDLWTAYESTTCLEAWLLDRPTLFLNPSGGDFPRSSLHEGTPVIESGGEASRALAELREAGSIAAFEAKAERRARVITETIQWDDGRNHVRAAHRIAELLAGLPRPPRRRPRLSEIAGALEQGLVLRTAPALAFLPGLRELARARGRFDVDELDGVRRRVRAATAEMDPVLSAREQAELEQVNR